MSSSQVSSQESYSITPLRDSKEYMYLSKDILSYLFKVLVILDFHEDLVALGLRVAKIYIAFLPDLFKDLGIHLFPLMIFSQNTLLTKANSEMKSSEELMNKFVDAWKEEWARKNKKKLRIARVEKTDEELRYEAERGVYEENYGQACAACQLAERQYESVIFQKKRFDSIFSTGSQLLEKVRQNAKGFLSKCILEQLNQGFPSLDLLLDNPTVSFELDSIIDQYSQVGR